MTESAEGCHDVICSFVDVTPDGEHDPGIFRVCLDLGVRVHSTAVRRLEKSFHIRWGGIPSSVWISDVYFSSADWMESSTFASTEGSV